MVNDRSVYNHKMKQWQIQGLNMSREEQKEKADTKEYVTRRTGNNEFRKLCKQKDQKNMEKNKISKAGI